MTTPETTPSGQRTFSAEIFMLDQRGDPGFRHARGDFYTRDAAAMFAITQATFLSAARGTPRVAVEIFNDRAEGSEVSFIGTPVELITTLSGLRDFAPATRRVRLPAPPDVQRAVDTAAGTAPPAHDNALGDAGVREVAVRSVRPYPLPHSRTFAGTFNVGDATRIADDVAAQLHGRVSMVSETVLLVTHDVNLPAADLASVELHNQTQRLQANMAVLDPIVDAAHIAQIQADLDALPRGAIVSAGSVGDGTERDPSTADVPAAVPADAGDDRPGRFLTAAHGASGGSAVTAPGRDEASAHSEQIIATTFAHIDSSMSHSMRDVGLG